MSGGVDSAVALVRAGPDAIGVTLRLWQDPAAPDTERACCSPAAVAAARATCHERGLPHVTLDLREEFKHAIVDPFTHAYEAGETPNPCMRCNGAFRFDELVAFARRAGADELWTGHYARIVERGRAPARRARGSTRTRISPTCSRPSIPRCSSTCGSRSASRRRRRRVPRPCDAGLAAAARRESQEACFLGGDDYRAFLERQGLRVSAGAIVGEDGASLGSHDGHWKFTPGQRRGLGVNGTRPLYVLRTDAATNTVSLERASDLAVTSIEARGRLHVPCHGRPR